MDHLLSKENLCEEYAFRSYFSIHPVVDVLLYLYMRISLKRCNLRTLLSLLSCENLNRPGATPGRFCDII